MKAKCPTCNKWLEVVESAPPEHFPFCSRRCRMADLDRWFTEEYSIGESVAGDGPGLDPEGGT